MDIPDMIRISELVTRKYQADGLEDTLSNAWMDFWEKFVLNDHVTPRLLERYGRGIKHQGALEASSSFHTSIDFTSNDNVAADVDVPSKKWVSGQTDFSQIRKYSIEHPSVYGFDDVTLFGTTGLCVSEDGEYISDSVSPPSRVDPRIPVSISKSMIEHGPLWTWRSMVRFDRDRLGILPGIEIGMPLIPLWRGYYHWLIEMLPRLAGAEQYYESNGQRPTLLVPPGLPSWAHSLLSIFTKDKYEFMILDERAYHLNRLVLPTYPEPSSVECSWIQSMTAEYSSGPEFPDRIFISREGANRRRIRNRETIAPILDEFDIEMVALEELSVLDQIRLFKGVDLVVGPHGAGFSNMVFSEDLTVLEIFGTKKKTTFYRLAEILDHDYQFIRGQSVRNDISIDPSHLRSSIDDCVGNHPNTR